jgi:hypothetical protein|tara:strand:+ start:2565 stop:2807 length:243 start_codon:yes stop_codon:yes gene_type:complete
MTQDLSKIEDVAKHFQVSVSTVRAWLRQGRIPDSTFIKLNDTYRFDIAKLQDALLAEKYDPDGEQLEMFSAKEMGPQGQT